MSRVSNHGKCFTTSRRYPVSSARGLPESSRYLRWRISRSISRFPCQCGEGVSETYVRETFTVAIGGRKEGVNSGEEK